MTTRLTQGKHFDAYEQYDKTEFLCNVTEETYGLVKQGEDVEIDFDGDGMLIWNAVITKKDRKNNRLYYYLP